MSATGGKEVKEMVLPEFCQRFGVQALYAFGSNADKAAALLKGEGSAPKIEGDLDIGVLLPFHVRLSVAEKVELAQALEDLFGVERVDLVLLSEANPFLALDIVDGERLFCADPDGTAEYELYVLRRAGDLEYFERERRRLILQRSSK